jgi:hypothetical protein
MANEDGEHSGDASSARTMRVLHRFRYSTLLVALTLFYALGRQWRLLSDHSSADEHTFTDDFPVLGSAVQRETPSWSRTSAALSRPGVIDWFGIEARWVSSSLSAEEAPVFSDIHCVGDNFMPNAATYRACQFRRLCSRIDSNTTTSSGNHLVWTLFQSAGQRQTRDSLNALNSSYLRSASTFGVHSLAVSTGPFLHQALSNTSTIWFPRVSQPGLGSVEDDDPSSTGYYELPPNVVLVPFSLAVPLSALKPGSTGGLPMSVLLFDYTLSIYNLLAMFVPSSVNSSSNHRVVLNLLNPEVCSAIYSGYKHDNSRSSHEDCFDLLRPIYRLFRLADPSEAIRDYNGNLLVTDQAALLEPSKSRSAWLCARRAVAGMGALSDHGTKRDHGQRLADYEVARNAARGPLLWKFRSFLLRNYLRSASDRDKQIHPLQVESLVTDGITSSGNVHRIVFVESSSSRSGLQNFARQRQFLASELSPSQVRIDFIPTASKSFLDRMVDATRTTFYICVMGEDAVPAFFLPRGGTLILFYNDLNETIANAPTKNPVKVNWDFWNNLSHPRVHWLPLSTSTSEADLRLLRDLILDELLFLAPQQLSGSSMDTKGPVDSAISHETAAIGGHMVRFVNSSLPPSAVHCLGDNFAGKLSASFRSCELRNLCFDALKPRLRRFILPIDERQRQFNRIIAERIGDHAVVSTRLDSSVMEGRNIRLHSDDPWFPEIINSTSINGYYEMDQTVMWIPYTAQKSNAKNPGHLLWDYFLPLYTLRSMYFGREQRLFLTSRNGLCSQTEDCRHMVIKFLPLLNVHDMHHADLEIPLQSTTRSPLLSSVVCSRHGATGMGMLTDHGYTRHGQSRDDYVKVHNAGRGPSFFDFRAFMLRNMNISADYGVGGLHERTSSTLPQVVFSMNSSSNPTRRTNFSAQIEYTRRDAIENDVAKADVYGIEMSKLPLKSQLEVMVQTTVFVSMTGGSTSIATFLPRDSTLILYFDDVSTFVSRSKKKDFPVMMDFDFWNNASYLRVHWLPASSMHTAAGLRALSNLIRSELNAQSTRADA